MLDTDFGYLLQPQPAPGTTANSKSVTDRFLRMLHTKLWTTDDSLAVYNDLSKILVLRRETGKKKYGTELQTFNGRIPLVDAFQEALDLCLYLCQDLAEKQEVDGYTYPTREELDRAIHILINLWWRLKTRA